MAVGVFDGLKEIELRIKGNSKGINKNVWDLIVK